MKASKAVKLCECGCGQPTPIARQTDRRLGYVNGQPMRFVSGHHLRKQKTLEDAFREKFTPGHPSECWEWHGQVANTGYGRVSYGKSRRMLAHRASYQIHRGSIPNGMVVCHKCDNPICVNPDHLFLGTQTDNMADKQQKGRQAKGEKSGPSKLTRSQVKEIRAQYQRGALQEDLAAQFGVVRSHISQIVNRKTWKHI